MKIFLRHLSDPDTINDDEVVGVKVITKTIVDFMVDPKTPKGAFKKDP